MATIDGGTLEETFTADGVTADELIFPAGLGVFALDGTFGGGTATMEVSFDGGTTYYPVTDAAGTTKTYTANGYGATIEDIILLRKCVGSEFGVKASGGIRSYEAAINLINAGASRLGTSSGSKIINEIKE